MWYGILHLAESWSIRKQTFIFLITDILKGFKEQSCYFTEGKTRNKLVKRVSHMVNLSHENSSKAIKSLFMSGKKFNESNMTYNHTQDTKPAFWTLNLSWLVQNLHHNQTAETYFSLRFVSLFYLFSSQSIVFKARKKLYSYQEISK